MFNSRPTTVAGVIAGFTKAVTDLEHVITAQEERAGFARRQIEMATTELAEAETEANKAESILAKLKELVE